MLCDTAARARIGRQLDEMERMMHGALALFRGLDDNEAFTPVDVNEMLATERPKIDRLTDQLNALSQHADDTIQNVNGAVSDVREPIRKDLADLQGTLQQAKQLLSDMQVLVRANDYKIDDTIENLRTVTENLDDLTESVKQRPWSLIRIKQPEDRKVPK